LNLDLLDIHDILKLNDHFMVQTNVDKTTSMLDNGSQTNNVNIGVASSITANAKIFISLLK